MGTSLEIINQLKINRQRAKRENELVADWIKPWSIYGSGYFDYERGFGINRGSLLDLVKEIRLEKEKRKNENDKTMVFGVDLFSDPTCLRSLSIGGVAVGLADHRNRKEREEDLKNGRMMVAGDLLLDKTWIRIKESFEKLGINGADLVTSSPSGGLNHITANKGIHFDLLSKAYSLLADQGYLFWTMQWRDIKQMNWYAEWIYNLTDGRIEIWFPEEQTLIIHKCPGAPEVLCK